MKDKTDKSCADIADIWEKLRGGVLGCLDGRVLSEDDLKVLAEHIKKTASFGAVFRLIDDIPKRGRAYDWNVGSILQHFDQEIVIDAIGCIDDLGPFYDSIGLAWVFGEYGGKNRFATAFLGDIMKKAENHEAWRLAAFSLAGKMGVKDPVDLMVRSLERDLYGDLEYCLSDIGDSRSACGVLMERSPARISKAVVPTIKNHLADDGSDRSIKRNCCWLAGHLSANDSEMLKFLTRFIFDEDYDLRHAAISAVGMFRRGDKLDILRFLSKEGDDLSKRLANRFLVGSFIG